MRTHVTANRTKSIRSGYRWFTDSRLAIALRPVALLFLAIVAQISTITARVTTVLVLLVTAFPVIAEPQGGQVVAGQGNIQQPDLNTTVVQQQSGSMAITWQSFDVASQELVRFEQPSSSATVLNQINQQRPSEIYGAIESNGRVFLMNPNGIVFGNEAQVNVGALVASSLNLSVADFMQGLYVFTASPGQQAGTILNRGMIQAASGGSITLLGGAVQNKGLIVADYGQVNLAAGSAMSLDFDGDGLIRFQVDDELVQNAAGIKSAVDNSGTISAMGGEVLLTASAAQNVFSELVNNAGLIEAGRIENKGGTVRLVGNGGATVHSGDIDVSAKDSNSSGGMVQVLGDQVRLTDGSHIDASGGDGGGTVLVGGDYQGNNPGIKNAEQTYVAATAAIEANAGIMGDGGKVIVWADSATDFAGRISARGGDSAGNGGFVEVSGRQTLAFTGRVDTSARNGRTGSLLIDPATLTIVDALAVPVGGYNEEHNDDGYGVDDDGDDHQSSCRRPRDNTIAWGLIDSLASDTNITLQATGDITVEDITGAAGGTTTKNNLAMLDLDQGSLNLISESGSVVFTDVNDMIRTEGGAITVLANGGHIVAGSLNTTGVAGNTSGAVQLAAMTDITVQSINAGNSDVTLQVDTNKNQSASLMITGPITGENVNLIGGSADDTLTGANTDNEWRITGEDAGTLNGMNFEQFANLGGSSGQDTFSLEGGNLSGRVDGGSGSDTLAGSSRYDITGANEGNAKGIGAGLNQGPGFKNIESLTGSAGNDVFAFNGSNAMISGVVNGEAGTDVLDYSNYIANPPLQVSFQSDATELLASSDVVVNLQNSTATATGGFQNIESLLGSTGTDAIIGANKAANHWQVNEDRSGSLNDSFRFENTEQLVGGSDADNLSGPDADTVWHMSNDGTVTVHGLNFTQIEILTGGSANDQFVFGKNKGMTGVVDGSQGSGLTVDNANTRAVTVNPEDQTITTASGNNGAGGYYNIEQIDGGAGVNTLVAANIKNDWNITGANSGDINEKISFDRIGNLTGGSTSDNFVISDGMGVTGVIDGGGGTDTLNYASWISPVVVDSEKGIATGTGGIRNIEAVLPGYPPEPTPWDVIEQTYIDEETADDITGESTEEQEKKAILSSLANMLNSPAIKNMSTDVLYSLKSRPDSNPDIIFRVQHIDDWLNEQDEREVIPLVKSVRSQRLLIAMADIDNFFGPEVYTSATRTDGGLNSAWGYIKVAERTGLEEIKTGNKMTGSIGISGRKYAIKDNDDGIKLREILKKNGFIRAIGTAATEVITLVSAPAKNFGFLVKTGFARGRDKREGAKRQAIVP